MILVRFLVSQQFFVLRYQSQETLNELLHVKKTSKNRSVKKSTGSSQLGDNSNKSVTYDEDVVHVKKKRMPA